MNCTQCGKPLPKRGYFRTRKGPHCEKCLSRDEKCGAPIIPSREDAVFKRWDGVYRKLAEHDRQEQSQATGAPITSERLQEIREDMAIARPLGIGLPCRIADELIEALEVERGRLDWLIERCEYLSGDRYEREHIDRSMAREAEQCS